MCTGGEGVPGSAAEALALVEAGLDYLTSPAAEEVSVAELAGVLETLSRTSAKHAAAWNTFLARFDANDCHDEDGYQSSAAWLAGKTRTKLSAARGRVRQMRNLSGRPALGQAMADGRLSESWASDIITWTKPLPEDLRDDIDRILLDAAAAGAELDDLAILARAAVEQWKSQRPDPDDPGSDGSGDSPGPDDGFEDRRLILDHTFGGAGRLSGDLTPECAAALQAVLDALGKKHGPADTRTRFQRFHDGIQEACELLIRAKMVPDRAGSDTRVDAVVSLGELLSLPGAGAVERAWLASGTGHHIYLSGTAAQAICCDALITPVVTGTADWTIITAIIELITDALTGTIHGTSASHGTSTIHGNDTGSGSDHASRDENHADDRQDSSGEPDHSADDHDRPSREEDRTDDGQDAYGGQDRSEGRQSQGQDRSGSGSGSSCTIDEQGISKRRDRASGRQERSGDEQDRSSGDSRAHGDGSELRASEKQRGRARERRSHDLPPPGDSKEHGGSGGQHGSGEPAGTDRQAGGSGQGGSAGQGDSRQRGGSAGQDGSGRRGGSPGQDRSEGRERLSDEGGGGEDDGGGEDRRAGGGGSGLPGQQGNWPPAQPAALALTPQAWEALLHAVARLSVRFVSGPGGLASALRRTLLPYPCNSRSVPLDVGLSQSIPEPIRRAVQLRDRRCRWPGGCDRPPSACDVHHVKHKKDGGPTSVSDCLLLCQYHHDICIHRWGWEIELLPGGEVTARGPRGQLLPGHGHGPPPPAEAA